MLAFLPHSIRGAITGILLLLNIMLVAVAIVILGLIKFIIPINSIKRSITNLQNDLPSIWIDVNRFILLLIGKIKWDIHAEGELHPDHWYFLIANHRSWLDILVLQIVFNRKVQILKFFMKKELLWSLPFGGLACWMLDFPFMKRYSKTELKKNPALRNKDIETTKKACNKFKLRPTTIMNFLEGTRFTEKKREERSSPYKHLLRPKAGGLAFVVYELKDYIHEVINVTILYDIPEPTFWDFLSGKIKRITLYYELLQLEAHHYGDYYQDSAFRKSFQHWVNDRWHEKDHLIDQVMAEQKLKTKEQEAAECLKRAGYEQKNTHCNS